LGDVDHWLPQHCTNPTARSLANALENISKPKEYNPVIVLQDKGDKMPLWLIHPGVGEILVFLGLAAHITDRPLYALRARGFERGESYFKDTQDAVTTYHEHIKRVQPKGPYAIGGYSFGSMYAFEITKMLNSNNDEVKMLAALNLPPHIKHRMRQLDWTACLLHLSYFLDFFTEEEAHAVHPELAKHDREYCLDWVVNRAPRERMDELALDKESLTNWADLAFALQYSAVDYEPSGLVDGIDVFCAIPLAAVAKNVDDWEQNHLGRWKDFTRTTPRIHRVKGAHYTMLTSEYLPSFVKTLNNALKQRGI
jgi:thioesterase domain-containing protein